MNKQEKLIIDSTFGMQRGDDEIILYRYREVFQRTGWLLYLNFEKYLDNHFWFLNSLIWTFLITWSTIFDF